jgi:replication factor A1
MSLTENAVRRIIATAKGGDDPGFKPVFQVISIKEVGSANTQTRFRTVLSDGEFFVQGMLATQINNLVTSGELAENCLICVRDFMNNSVQGKNVIILLNVQIVGHETGRVGDPVDIEKSGGVNLANSSNNSNTAGANGPAQPMYNRTNHTAPPNIANNANANANVNPYVSPAKSNGVANNPPSGRNPYSPARSNAPIVHQDATSSPSGGLTTLISQLNMYQNRWTIKTRIVTKSEIRTWSNSKGEGSLFSVELLDSSGMDIRATLFKEAVDKFYNYFEVGKVYTIAGGRLKVANAKFNTCKSQYEISLDQNAEIHLVDDQGEIQKQSFEFVKIADLERVEAEKNVDIIAVVQEIGEVQNLTSKRTGKELQKAELTLLDDTGASVRLTLWGAEAVSARSKIGINQVVGFRRTRVSDYGGKTLSGGTPFPEPEMPETSRLQQWWDTQGSHGTTVKSLSGGGGGGGRMDPFADRRTIADIKNQGLGYNSEKGDYLCFKAHFTFMKKDKEGGAWYPACPNKEEPCRNRCKVTQTTDGNWDCLRCHGVFPTCNRKWIFSTTVADDTGSTWVSVFNEDALTLFGGVIADDVFAQYDNQDLYDGYFAKATYTDWVMKCKVKNEIVNDEPRLKTQIVRMDPVDYASECKDLLTALQGFQTT